MSENQLCVYLAGPINGRSDAEVFQWRDEATGLLPGIATISPAARDYRGREMEPGIAEEIIGGDKDDISKCDAVLAWCPSPSVGTSMEIFYCYELLKKPVVSVVPDGPISPWLLGHSNKVCRTLAEACDFLRRLTLGRLSLEGFEK